ncbi:unnamed protein product [Arctogadus glacialis]
MIADMIRLLAVLLLLGSGAAVSYSDCKPYNERSTKGAARPLAPNATDDKKVFCSNIELDQVLPFDSFPNRTVTLISSWTLPDKKELEELEMFVTKYL